MLLRSSYYMVLRMLRGYLGLAILIGLPIAVISVIGLVARGAVDSPLGIPVMDMAALTNILAFQLFGGNYTLEFIKEDLYSARKWRMYSLPYPAHIHAYSILLSSTIFSALQGFIIVLFTRWVYDVQWGNLGLVFLALLVLSVVTQLVYSVIALGINNGKLAERLGEVYGLGSIVLAGVWFPMPQAGFFQFLTTYGNPLSLAQNIMLVLMTGNNLGRGLISLAILLSAGLVLSILSVSLGRRKLA